jgi:hypothetical protein
LLSFILDATETTSGPEVAPAGTVKLIDVVVQELVVTRVLFKKTTPLPGDAPKFDPLTTTWLPADPVVAETLVIAGAGLGVELMDMLSIVPEYAAPVVPLLTATPT